MAKVSVYNIEGKEVDTIELNDAVFGVEVNEHLVHMAVVNQLANNRQGTQKAKTRSEVSGGGRKPWRQKGTGHARQGSTRAPQWTGGGVVFAPVPRDYSFKMNKKEKRAALKSALSSRVEENKFIERLYNYPEVYAVYLISGSYDLLVTLEGKTLKEVSRFVSERLSTIDGVLSTATYFILKKYKDHGTIMGVKKGSERIPVTL